MEIRQGAKVENSLIRGPTPIAEDCQIRNSCIGPFTAIGAATVIENSSTEHSVILEGYHVLEVEDLTDSIIGMKTEVMTKAEPELLGVEVFHR